MNKSVLTAAFFAVIAGGASAEGWHHAAAPMGQFEGNYSTSDESYGLFYGCTGMSSRLTFSAKGAHIAAGLSSITVDGKEVATGDTTYSSRQDRTIFSSDVQRDWGQLRKDEHNAIITALATGSEAIWTTPSGDRFTFDLTGSSGIKKCEMS
ncbi:hypothetical protein [Salipiger sp. CCB-MM3]|uniref:hypothetical protein n=1 Tax=Salipiger sp. CCB-MM3 TaxID=1792508 RepID=UPI000AE888E1|nr:hypothetical protein [Salipiger sp. CCB-MM3]